MNKDLEPSENNLLTIAFYNVENFYSDINQDKSFLPSNFEKWKDGRYQRKVTNIAEVISKIGVRETKRLPSLIGLCEVENEKVLKDLVKNDYLYDYNYQYIIYQSLDERNINVALLYDPTIFSLKHSDILRLSFKNNEKDFSYTRDILHVSGFISEKEIHLFIIHLPSKVDKEINEEKRKLILINLRKRIDQIRSDQPLSNIIIMGDFNDPPTHENIRLILDTRAKIEDMTTDTLYNPMVKLMNFSRGSLTHRRQWMIFDQILLSQSFVKKKSEIRMIKTDIFDQPFLYNKDLNVSKQPYRTSYGPKYVGGYSDHFPVYTILKY